SEHRACLDDDGNFTKWMSSYWGHGAESGHSRERKRMGFFSPPNSPDLHI
uniref:Uncharacterized protein n=1 Tax=Acanthochromis polyacanthus TaxID=80966 RepID=A0A3Q1E973_9TELE